MNSIGISLFLEYIGAAFRWVMHNFFIRPFKSDKQMIGLSVLIGEGNKNTDEVGANTLKNKVAAVIGGICLMMFF